MKPGWLSGALALLTTAVAFGCGGKSAMRNDGEPSGADTGAGGAVESVGGTSGSGGGGALGGGTSEAGGGRSQPELGSACQSDYDCLRVIVAPGTVAVCTNERCEIGAPRPMSPSACYTEVPLPQLELNDWRVYHSPSCPSGLCLHRAYALDPGNTMCTSRCASAANCAGPFVYTTDCLPTQIYEDGDTGVFVGICTPPRPW